MAVSRVSTTDCASHSDALYLKRLLCVLAGPRPIVKLSDYPCAWHVSTGPRVRNARRANAEQAETAVTPHVSAEIVALAGTNRIAIGTVKRWIGLQKGWEAYQKLIFLSDRFRPLKFRTYKMYAIRSSDPELTDDQKYYAD